jgi:hypothetical protein
MLLVHTRLGAAYRLSLTPRIFSWLQVTVTHVSKKKCGPTCLFTIDRLKHQTPSKHAEDAEAIVVTEGRETSLYENQTPTTAEAEDGLNTQGCSCRQTAIHADAETCRMR